MAVPTITLIDPGEGEIRGGALVRITGTGFADYVEVAFGAQAGLVARSGVLPGGGDAFVDLLLPEGPDVPVGAEAPDPVDVVLRNLDAEGDPVPGEAVTAAAAFQWRRLDLLNDSPMVRLAKAIVLSLRRGVLEATEIATAVEYEDDDGAVRLTTVAKTPSLVLAGPTATRNNFLRRLAYRTEALPNGDVRVRGPSLTYDLEWVLNVYTRTNLQRFQLAGACVGWLRAHPWISMLTDEGDPDSGLSRWRIEPGEVKLPPGAPAGVWSATVDFTVKGFDLDAGLPVGRARAVTETLLTDEPM